MIELVFKTILFLEQLTGMSISKDDMAEVAKVIVYSRSKGEREPLQAEREPLPTKFEIGASSSI